MDKIRKKELYNISLEIYNQLCDIFKTRILESHNLKRGFYDKNWINHIDCVYDVEDRLSIINWLTILDSCDKSIFLEDFIYYRTKMFDLIDKYYPEIKSKRVFFGYSNLKDPRLKK